MAEYIEREPLLNHLKHRVAPMSDGEQLRKGVNLALEILEEAVAMLPAADVAPVVHGHWCEENFFGTTSLYRCSECKSKDGFYINPTKYKYCPDCGAKMEEEVSNA